MAIPLVIAFLISGNAMNTHSIRELLPRGAIFYWLGLFGLILDGAAGIVFQAPLYALAILALPRWRSMPDGFRLGMSASLLYILYLIPRSEWHGGWSPPLRYIVVLMPILALGAAVMWERICAGSRSVIAHLDADARHPRRRVSLAPLPSRDRRELHRRVAEHDLAQRLLAPDAELHPAEHGGDRGERIARDRAHRSLRSCV